MKEVEELVWDFANHDGELRPKTFLYRRTSIPTMMLSEELKVYRKYGGQLNPKCSITSVPHGVKFRLAFLIA